VLRLSSNLTLFWRIFVPVFWTTIMVGLCLVVWFSPEHYFGGVPLESLRWAVLLILGSGLATFWLALWPLRRVETDGKRIFVTDYFRTAGYRIAEDVEGIEVNRFLWMKICTLRLKGKGSFGQRIKFIAASKQFADFRGAYAGAISFS
jgi:hypothetical protein